MNMKAVIFLISLFNIIIQICDTFPLRHADVLYPLSFINVMLITLSHSMESVINYHDSKTRQTGQ